MNEKALEVSAMASALAGTSFRLHGIASRTQPEQIATEVLRLNDAVRSGALGRVSYNDQPADFLNLLLAEADSSNGGDKQ